MRLRIYLLACLAFASALPASYAAAAVPRLTTALAKHKIRNSTPWEVAIQRCDRRSAERIRCWVRTYVTIEDDETGKILLLGYTEEWADAWTQRPVWWQYQEWLRKEKAAARV